MPGFIVSPSDRKLINPKHICPCCDFVLNDPVQTLCGHFYCFSCVDELKEPNHRDYRCIKDNVWFTKQEIFRDRCVQREVENLPFQVRCPRKDCTWEGRITEYEEHVSRCSSNATNETSGAGIELGGCPYEIVGCKVPKNLTAEQLKEHNTKCADFHLKLMLKHVRESSPASYQKKVDQLTEQVRLQANRIFELEEDKKALQRRQSDTDNSNANLGLLIAELSTNVEQLNAKVNVLEKHRENDAKTINALKNKLGAHESPRNSPVTTLSHDQSPPVNDGILLWKITDFARKRNEALANRKLFLNSPVFYSDNYGYKMCARIYLNGDGMGRGNSISLFFLIMRGEYDALLRWPFRQKVTMMLLDQNHVEHVIDAFKPDPSSSSFKRPTSEMNVASGCPMFCPLADLDKYTYVKDDTMFVKIIVDTSDIF